MTNNLKINIYSTFNNGTPLLSLNSQILCFHHKSQGDLKLCDRCDCVPSVRQQYLYFDNYIDFGTYEVTDVPVDRLHGWFEHQKLL